MDDRSIRHTLLRTPCIRYRWLHRYTCKQLPLVACLDRELVQDGPRSPESEMFVDYSSPPSSLGFLEFYKKTFELRCVSIWINRGGRKRICRSQRCLPFLFRYPAIAPVNGYANLISLLAVNHHRLNAFGYHRFRDINTTGTGDSDFFAARDSHLIGELRRHFDKRLGYKLHIHPIVLGPVMIMLGQPIGRADDIEAFRRCAQLIHV